MSLINRPRIKKMLASENRYYNHEWPLSLLNGATVSVLIYTVLFSIFFQMSRAENLQNADDTLMSIILLVVFLFVMLALSILKRFVGYEYSLVMIMTAIAYIFTALSLLIYLRQLLEWDLTGIAGADFGKTVAEIAGTGLKAGGVFLVLLIILSLLPARHSKPFFGFLWFLCPFAPISIFPMTIYLTTAIEQTERFSVAIPMMSVYFSLLCCLIVRFAFKSILFRIFSLANRGNTVVESHSQIEAAEMQSDENKLPARARIKDVFSQAEAKGLQLEKMAVKSGIRIKRFFSDEKKEISFKVDKLLHERDTTTNAENKPHQTGKDDIWQRELDYFVEQWTGRH